MASEGEARWRSWDRGALLLRVVLGLIMILHGSQKVFGAFGGSGPEGFTGFVGSLGFQPAPLWAGVAMFAEMVGGFLVLLGAATEVGALLFAGNMLVVILRVDWADGFFNRNGGIEFPLMLLTVATALVLGGPGAYALWDPFRRR